MKRSITVTLLIGAILLFSCKKEDSSPVCNLTSAPEVQQCDFKTLKKSSSESHSFYSSYSDNFKPNTRWKSIDADITANVFKGQGELFTDSKGSPQFQKAWRLYKKQMPYNRSWELFVAIGIPAYWNSQGGKDARVGLGMFAGKPVASGESTKVYACNFVAGTGSKRFVQAELMGDRLQNVLVDRQEKVVDQSKEIVALSIRFCSYSKTLSFLMDYKEVGTGVTIHAKGTDDWNLSESDGIDIGFTGFAENALVASHPPMLKNFFYRIY